jgi:hypothetical protein
MPVEVQSWTCDRCEVSVQWMAEHQANAGLPAHWSREDEGLLCLGCRRELAGESALADIDESMPVAERVKLRSRARLEFEINRDPGRANSLIARSCHTSAAVVKKARERMGEGVAL